MLFSKGIILKVIHQIIKIKRMIIHHLSNYQLIAQIKMYNIIINYSNEPSRTNIINFREQFKQELKRRTNNV